MSGYGPEPGPDGRLRPRYGEYATPDEQRAHIREPQHAPQHAPQHDPVAGPHPAVAVPAGRPSPAAASAQHPAVAAVRSGHTADRIATFALLGYGLFTVVSAVPAYLDYAAYVKTFLGMIGVDAQLADPAAARGWGIAAAAVLVVGWLVTAIVSWRRLRSGRLTWWVPVVAGAVCMMVSGVLLTVPLTNDPAVWQAVQKVFGR